MVQSTSGIQSSNAANEFILNATPSLGTTDFAQQLLTAIEGLLQNSENGSKFEIDITPSQGQNSDGSQLTVTVKNTSAASAAPSSSASSTSQSTPVTLMSSVTPITTTTQTQPTPTPGTQAATPASTQAAVASTPALSSEQLANMTPDQAYWASQPAAVQALQNMPTDQRYEAAQQLASEGYTIDVPIMVDGMDPLATMIQRQIDGYTWVPSALQANIPVGPGIDYPGPAYDPNNPPPGSIQVTTDFAAGTNMQDMWIKPQQITNSMAGINA